MLSRGFALSVAVVRYTFVVQLYDVVCPVVCMLPTCILLYHAACPVTFRFVSRLYHAAYPVTFR